MSEIEDLTADLQAALTRHEPMTTNWVLVFETTELDDDGDVGGAWGVLASSPTSLAHVALLDLAHERLVDSYRSGGDDE